MESIIAFIFLLVAIPVVYVALRVLGVKISHNLVWIALGLLIIVRAYHEWWL